MQPLSRASSSVTIFQNSVIVSDVWESAALTPSTDMNEEKKNAVNCITAIIVTYKLHVGCSGQEERS